MANECACVICTLSRLNGGCLRGHACMHGVGPVCVRRTGCALVGRAHNIRHRCSEADEGAGPGLRPQAGLVPSRWLAPGCILVSFTHNLCEGLCVPLSMFDHTHTAKGPKKFGSLVNLHGL